MVQSHIPSVRHALGYSLDETAFLRSDIKRNLEEMGFLDIEIMPRDWLHPSTPPGLIRMVQGLEPFVEKVPLLREIAGSIYIKATV